jgi:hypothetical protein
MLFALIHSRRCSLLYNAFVNKMTVASLLVVKNPIRPLRGIISKWLLDSRRTYYCASQR